VAVPVEKCSGSGRPVTGAGLVVEVTPGAGRGRVVVAEVAGRGGLVVCRVVAGGATLERDAVPAAGRVGGCVDGRAAEDEEDGVDAVNGLAGLDGLDGGRYAGTVDVAADDVDVAVSGPATGDEAWPCIVTASAARPATASDAAQEATKRPAGM
jgi:hypothetical protein